MNVDSKLLQSCLNKERAAQYELYRICYSFMMGICMRYAKDKEEASSLMNEGFLKILTQLEKYKNHIPFELWMRRIIINNIIDQYRKNKKAKEMIEYKDFSDIENESGPVLNLAVEKMDVEQLHKFIDKLPAMSRRVFNLFVIDGYTHAEISGLLSISEGTSKWHMNNARQKLKEMILNFGQTSRRKIA